MDIKNLIKNYEEGVFELADKLPQWTKQADKTRRNTAVVSSMFEECGEICGLISKYETRNIKGVDMWNLENFDDLPYEKKLEIHNKFVDETGDFIWVLTAAMHSLGCNLSISELFDSLDRYEEIKDLKQLQHYVCNDSVEGIKLSLNIMSEVMYDIYLLYDSVLSNVSKIAHTFRFFIIEDFAIFIKYLNLKYNICSEEILMFNMDKLGVRYDSNGNRLDGKL